MKNYYLLSIILLMSLKVFASHNRSAEISYTHISGYNYQVQIITYTKTSSNIDRPSLIFFYGDGTLDTIPRISQVNMIGDVSQNTYSRTHLYPGPGNYVMHFEDMNRNGGVVNIPNSVNTSLYTEAGLVINGTDYNNSVKFLQMPLINTILNTSLTYNMTAYDPDSDCLRFELVNCRGTGGIPLSGYYIPADVAIDSINGEMTWINPPSVGEYNFAVKVEDWRNGILIGYVIRDFQITVNYPPALPFYFTGNNTWQTDASGNYTYVLSAGGSLNLNLSYTDSLASTIDLNPYTEMFLLANQPVFTKTVSAPTVSSMFSWTANSANVRSAPYIVTFRGTSEGLYHNDISLLIYVTDPFTLPCSFIISANLINPIAEAFSIFPNPAAGTFTIKGLVSGSVNHLIIYDLLGRPVKNLTLPDSEYIVDATDLSVGFYVYELRNETSVLAKGKIVLK